MDDEVVRPPTAADAARQAQAQGEQGAATPVEQEGFNIPGHVPAFGRHPAEYAGGEEFSEFAAHDAATPRADAADVMNQVFDDEDHMLQSMLAPRFHVHSQLGRGSYGRVVLARDDFTGELVALKVSSFSFH